MFILCYLILLVHASSWFSTEPEYSKWSTDELRTWLEHRNIKTPPSFDQTHLHDLVGANWQTYLAEYADAGRHWTLDQFNKAQRAFQHIKDDSFDSWNESRLRIFLLEQGVVAPSGPREQLVIAAKNKYRAYTDAAKLYSSLASASASSVYAGATDAAHSTSQCISNAVAQATHEIARAFDHSRDYVHSTWDEGQLRSWLEEHGVVEAKTASTKDELMKLANDHYRKATSAVWESWSDSYIVGHHIYLTWLTADNCSSGNGSLRTTS